MKALRYLMVPSKEQNQKLQEELGERQILKIWKETKNMDSSGNQRNTGHEFLRRHSENKYQVGIVALENRTTEQDLAIYCSVIKSGSVPCYQGSNKVRQCLTNLCFLTGPGRLQRTGQLIFFNHQWLPPPYIKNR